MNFGEARFWELLLVGLAVILLIRFTLAKFRLQLGTLTRWPF